MSTDPRSANDTRPPEACARNAENRPADATAPTTSTKSSRRQFLKGRAAADALLDLAGPPPADAPSSPPDAASGYLVQFTRRAMACDFEVILPAGRQGAAAEHAVAALEIVARLEEQMTIYRDDSEVSRLNAAAAQQPVEVESGLFALLCRADELSRLTAGAFDITSGALNRLWRDALSAGHLPDRESVAAATAHDPAATLSLDAKHQTVAFRDPRVLLDLGAIGKGFAIDRVRQQLVDDGLSDFLVHGAGSSVFARGVPSPSPDDAGGWSVGVRHPLFPARRLAEIRLRDQALSTSGTLTQSFRHRGRRYGHIVDPRTGWPADTGLYSATVVAPTAADADALSTALLVMGRQAALDFCHTHPQFAALLSGPGRAADSVRLTHIGIPPEQISWLVPCD